MKTVVVMTRDVVVVAPTASAAAARRMMRRRGIRHLPVVDGGHLVGVLSDRDLLRADALPPEPAPITCGEVMTPAPVTCPPDASVGRVAELMLQHKIDSVPVVGLDGRLVGLVTSTDLLGLLVEREGVTMLPFDFRVRTATAVGEGVLGLRGTLTSSHKPPFSS
jgi:acetoin utilization protein AcuB